MEGRDKNGRFAKNHKISTGRNQYPELEELRVALAKAHTQKGLSILEHFVKRAYKNDRVLVAVMKKLMADKTYIDAETKTEGKIEIIIKDYKDEDKSDNIAKEKVK